MSLTAALPTLIALATAMLALGTLANQINLRTQSIVLHLTGSVNLATLAIFILFLPGVVVHESAHWLAARLLGLRTSHFQVWPERQGNYIRLGSVGVQRGGIWLDSLVGLAPLLMGTVLVAFIGAQVFGAADLLYVLEDGRWLDGAEVFFAALGNADGFVWAYLLFVISNSMMPSKVDREPVGSVVLYLALAALIYIVVGLPIEPVTALLSWVIPAFQIVISALIFTILLDLMVFGVLLLTELLVARR